MGAKGTPLFGHFLRFWSIFDPFFQNPVAGSGLFSDFFEGHRYPFLGSFCPTIGTPQIDLEIC